MSISLWSSRTSASNNNWRSVTYGNGLFVAVAESGTGNRVMTSSDGITWTLRTSAADNNWWGVTYGNGLFVAVASSGTGNRVMTSPDGITWTLRTSAADNNWFSVTYGNGLFVAVASFVGVNRVMTSPDGITWTLRTPPIDNNWFNVTYGNGLFVAVASSGTGNRVMTSPDGITWTLRTSAADNNWYSVTYGNSLFVAVATSGTGNRVMTATTVKPSITNFSIPTKIYGDTSFVISQPTSNSNGSFNYNSSDLLIETITGNTITIVGPGISTITASQSETVDYTSGKITTPSQVNQSTPANPVIIDSSYGLLYFMNTSSSYCNIINNIKINNDLIASSYKVITGNNITITKSNN